MSYGRLGYMVVVTGDKAVDKALASLSSALQKKIIRKGLRAGAKVVQREAKGLAPVGAGLTRKAVAVRAAKGRSRKNRAIRINVELTRREEILAASGNSFYYPASGEYGRKLPKGGRVEGKHWMKSAKDRADSAATQAALDSIRAQIANLK